MEEDGEDNDIMVVEPTSAPVIDVSDEDSDGGGGGGGRSSQQSASTSASAPSNAPSLFPSQQNQTSVQKQPRGPNFRRGVVRKSTTTTYLLLDSDSDYDDVECCDGPIFPSQHKDNSSQGRSTHTSGQNSGLESEDPGKVRAEMLITSPGDRKLQDCAETGQRSSGLSDPEGLEEAEIEDDTQASNRVEQMAAENSEPCCGVQNLPHEDPFSVNKAESGSTAEECIETETEAQKTKQPEHQEEMSAEATPDRSFYPCVLGMEVNKASVPAQLQQGNAADSAETGDYREGGGVNGDTDQESTSGEAGKWGHTASPAPLLGREKNIYFTPIFAEPQVSRDKCPQSSQLKPKGGDGLLTLEADCREKSVRSKGTSVHSDLLCQTAEGNERASTRGQKRKSTDPETLVSDTRPTSQKSLKRHPEQNTGKEQRVPWEIAADTQHTIKQETDDVQETLTNVPHESHSKELKQMYKQLMQPVRPVLLVKSSQDGILYSTQLNSLSSAEPEGRCHQLEDQSSSVENPQPVTEQVESDINPSHTEQDLKQEPSDSDTGLSEEPGSETQTSQVTSREHIRRDPYGLPEGYVETDLLPPDSLDDAGDRSVPYPVPSDSVGKCTYSSSSRSTLTTHKTQSHSRFRWDDDGGNDASSKDGSSHVQSKIFQSIKVDENATCSSRTQSSDSQPMQVEGGMESSCSGTEYHVPGPIKTEGSVEVQPVNVDTDSAADTPRNLEPFSMDFRVLQDHHFQAHLRNQRPCNDLLTFLSAIQDEKILVCQHCQQRVMKAPVFRWGKTPLNLDIVQGVLMITLSELVRQNLVDYSMFSHPMLVPIDYPAVWSFVKTKSDARARAISLVYILLVMEDVLHNWTLSRKSEDQIRSWLNTPITISTRMCVVKHYFQPSSKFICRSVLLSQRQMAWQYDNNIRQSTDYLQPSMDATSLGTRPERPFVICWKNLFTQLDYRHSFSQSLQLMYPFCPCKEMSRADEMERQWWRRIEVQGSVEPQGSLNSLGLIRFMGHNVFCFMEGGRVHISIFELEHRGLMPSNYPLVLTPFFMEQLQNTSDARAITYKELAFLQQFFSQSGDEAKRTREKFVFTPYGLHQIYQKLKKRQFKYEQHVKAVYYMMHLGHHCAWSLQITPPTTQLHQVPGYPHPDGEEQPAAMIVAAPSSSTAEFMNEQDLSLTTMYYDGGGGTPPEVKNVVESLNEALKQTIRMFNLQSVAESFCDCRILATQLHKFRLLQFHGVELNHVTHMMFAGHLLHCWKRTDGFYVSLAELQSKGLLVEGCTSGVPFSYFLTSEKIFINTLPPGSLNGQDFYKLIELRRLHELYTTKCREDPRRLACHKFYIKLWKHFCPVEEDQRRAPEPVQLVQTTRPVALPSTRSFVDLTASQTGPAVSSTSNFVDLTNPQSKRPAVSCTSSKSKRPAVSCTSNSVDLTDSQSKRPAVSSTSKSVDLTDSQSKRYAVSSTTSTSNFVDLADSSDGSDGSFREGSRAGVDTLLSGERVVAVSSQGSQVTTSEPRPAPSQPSLPVSPGLTVSAKHPAPASIHQDSPVASHPRPQVSQTHHVDPSVSTVPARHPASANVQQNRRAASVEPRPPPPLIASTSVPPRAHRAGQTTPPPLSSPLSTVSNVRPRITDPTQLPPAVHKSLPTRNSTRVRKHPALVVLKVKSTSQISISNVMDILIEQTATDSGEDHILDIKFQKACKCPDRKAGVFPSYSFLQCLYNAESPFTIFEQVGQAVIDGKLVVCVYKADEVFFSFLDLVISGIVKGSSLEEITQEHFSLIMSLSSADTLSMLLREQETITNFVGSSEREGLHQSTASVLVSARLLRLLLYCQGKEEKCIYLHKMGHICPQTGSVIYKMQRLNTKMGHVQSAWMRAFRWCQDLDQQLASRRAGHQPCCFCGCSALTDNDNIQRASGESGTDVTSPGVADKKCVVFVRSLDEVQKRVLLPSQTAQSSDYFSLNPLQREGVMATQQPQREEQTLQQNSDISHLKTAHTNANREISCEDMQNTEIPHQNTRIPHLKTESSNQDPETPFQNVQISCQKADVTHQNTQSFFQKMQASEQNSEVHHQNTSAEVHIKQERTDAHIKQEPGSPCSTVTGEYSKMQDDSVQVKQEPEHSVKEPEDSVGVDQEPGSSVAEQKQGSCCTCGADDHQETAGNHCPISSARSTSSAELTESHRTVKIIYSHSPEDQTCHVHKGLPKISESLSPCEADKVKEILESSAVEGVVLDPLCKQVQLLQDEKKLRQLLGTCRDLSHVVLMGVLHAEDCRYMCLGVEGRLYVNWAEVVKELQLRERSMLFTQAQTLHAYLYVPPGFVNKRLSHCFGADVDILQSAPWVCVNTLVAIYNMGSGILPSEKMLKRFVDITPDSFFFPLFFLLPGS